MSDRRSGRSRKTVDYSKFAGGDSDNDDDFRESSTQSTKRKKNESSSPKSVKVKLTKVDADSYKIEAKKTEKPTKNNEDHAPKNRLSVSDKVFQRHLSEALEISKQDDSETLSSKTENANSLLLNGQGKNSHTEVDHPVPNDVNSTATDEPALEEKQKRNKSSDENDEWNDATSSESEEEEDDSDWSDEDKETKVKKPAVKSRKSEGNRGEEDESDWSDGNEKNKSKKSTIKKSEPKKQPKKILSPKTPKASKLSLKTSASPKPMTPKLSKPSNKVPTGSTVSLGLKPSGKTSGTPCQVISSPVKLPPKGIRLGLSRKVSAKPLHSVIKVQQ